jgi:chromosome segregation ATPase
MRTLVKALPVGKGRVFLFFCCNSNNKMSTF